MKRITGTVLALLTIAFSFAGCKVTMFGAEKETGITKEAPFDTTDAGNETKLTVEIRTQEEETAGKTSDPAESEESLPPEPPKTSAPPQTTKKTAPPETTKKTDPPKQQTGYALSPEEATDLYLKNTGVWKLPYPSVMGGYGYLLLDLDFDGVLELISCCTDGTGRFSVNRYYRINLSSRTVEQIKAPASEENSGFDYALFTESFPQLYRNRANGSRFYFCRDFTYVTYGEYGNYFGALSLRNNSVQTETLFSEYHCDAGLEGNEEEINSFSYHENGNANEVSQSEYDQKRNEFTRKNVDLHLKIAYIPGGDFDNASEQARRVLFLNAYRNFSYDGFSFS